MIFADMGEGRIAPGVAPANGRRQANGMIAYGTHAGLLPALPPNFAAVAEGTMQTAPAPPPSQPTTYVMPTKSTTLPQTVTSLTVLTKTATSSTKPATYPQIMTAPAPPPQGPAAMPNEPSAYPSDFVMPQGSLPQAPPVQFAPPPPASAKLSTTGLVAVGLVAALAAGTGLYIVMKKR